MVNVAMGETYTLSTMPYKGDDPGQESWGEVTTSFYRALLPSAFEQAVSFFEKNRADIEKGFSGKYVAIWRDTILDSDTDFSRLAGRVYEQYGYLAIYMPFVGRKSMLEVRSPRVAQLKKDVP